MELHLYCEKMGGARAEARASWTLDTQSSQKLFDPKKACVLYALPTVRYKTLREKQAW